MKYGGKGKEVRMYRMYFRIENKYIHTYGYYHNHFLVSENVWINGCGSNMQSVILIKWSSLPKWKGRVSGLIEVWIGVASANEHHLVQTKYLYNYPYHMYRVNYISQARAKPRSYVCTCTCTSSISMSE